MINYIGGFKVCSLKFVRTCKLMVVFVCYVLIHQAHANFQQ